MPGSLIEALKEGHSNTGKCSVGHFIRNLPDDEKEAVIEAMRKCKSTDLEDKHFNFAWLAKTLKDNGKPEIKAINFRRHMRGDCSCEAATR